MTCALCYRDLHGDVAYSGGVFCPGCAMKWVNSSEARRLYAHTKYYLLDPVIRSARWNTAVMEALAQAVEMEVGRVAEAVAGIDQFISSLPEGKL